jgi:hypothetical protein
MEPKKCKYCGNNIGTTCGWFTVDILEFDESEQRSCFSNDSCSSDELPF